MALWFDTHWINHTSKQYWIMHTRIGGDTVTQLVNGKEKQQISLKDSGAYADTYNIGQFHNQNLMMAMSWTCYCGESLSGTGTSAEIGLHLLDWAWRAGGVLVGKFIWKLSRNSSRTSSKTCNNILYMNEKTHFEMEALFCEWGLRRWGQPVKLPDSMQGSRVHCSDFPGKMFVFPLN